MPGLVDMWVRRSRPGAFSGLQMEFDDDARQIVLRTRDDLLVPWHFQTLFAPYLPAGTYAEVVYFLPAAFRYLFDRRKDFGEMVPAVVGWIAANSVSLHSEGLFAPARQNLLICLSEWTGDFHVDLEDFSHWSCDRGSPRNSEVVSDTLVEIAKHEVHVDLAVQFLRGLSYRSSSRFQLAWFLELSVSLVPENRFLPARRAVPLPAEVAAIIQDGRLSHSAWASCGKFAGIWLADGKSVRRIPFPARVLLQH